MPEQINIKIVLGSTRPNRFSEKLGPWVLQEAKKNGEIDAEILDLREYPMPFYNEPMSPSSIKDGAYPNELVRKWADKIREADAFILVTPEYNHGTSGVLKNALDSVYAEWNNKAVGFVAYGSVGGARAVEHLRLVSAELQMASVRNAVYIPAHWNTQEENGNIKEGAFEPFTGSMTALADQLVRWAKALKAVREL